MAATETRARERLAPEEVRHRLPPMKPVRFVKLRWVLGIATLALVVGLIGGLFLPWGGTETIEVAAPAPAVTVPRMASRYAPEADFGIRHLGELGVVAPPLSTAADYATRHMEFVAPAPTQGLTPEADFGIRHLDELGG